MSQSGSERMIPLDVSLACHPSLAAEQIGDGDPGLAEHMIRTYYARTGKEPLSPVTISWRDVELSSHVPGKLAEAERRLEALVENIPPRPRSKRLPKAATLLAHLPAFADRMERQPVRQRSMELVYVGVASILDTMPMLVTEKTELVVSALGARMLDPDYFLHLSSPREGSSETKNPDIQDRLPFHHDRYTFAADHRTKDVPVEVKIRAATKRSRKYDGSVLRLQFSGLAQEVLEENELFPERTTLHTAEAAERARLLVEHTARQIVGEALHARDNSAFLDPLCQKIRDQIDTKRPHG